MLILLFMRAVSGLVLAMVLGYVGTLVADGLFRSTGADWPEWLFTFAWFTGGGLGAGVGSFLAWIPTESSRPRVMLIFLVVLLASLGGAWGGYYWKVYIDESLSAFSGRAITSVALFGAAIGASLMAGSLGVVRQLRSGWQ